MYHIILAVLKTPIYTFQPKFRGTDFAWTHHCPGDFIGNPPPVEGQPAIYLQLKNDHYEIVTGVAR